jgi:hypothetical protein
VKAPDVSGQAYALTVMTPIERGKEDALRAYLESFRNEHLPSPLARLPRTHFGRWVIIPDYHSEEAQPKPDGLASQYLLFTACFDGELDSYLGELSETLAPEAEEIWGRCVGCPRPAQGAALKSYLTHNQQTTGFFVAAYGEATVQEVQAALAQRSRLIDFAGATQGVEPEELQRRFASEIGA